MEKKPFRKGDIVETPYDISATVNFVDYETGEMGVNVDQYGKNAGRVVKIAECKLLKRALHVPRTEKPIHEMTIEELKAELEGHRYGQKTVIANGHKKKRKKKTKSTKRTTRTKTKGKKQSKIEALKGILSDEEIQKLKKKALEKKGDE